MTSPYKTTVSVAAATYDLTVLATVKEELGITNNASDTMLARMISEQSEVAAKYCRSQFTRETLIDQFQIWGYSAAPLIVSRRPVVSIVSIVEGSTTLGSTDYEYDSDTGEVWRLSSDVRSYWAVSSRVTVTYVGGYELLTTLPRDIERAVLMLIKQSWFERTRDPRARSETVEGVGSTDYWVGTIPGTAALPAEATVLLEPYRAIFV